MASEIKEGERILERMRRELKEGDLVEISLKDNAQFVPGISPTITLDNSGRTNGPNKSCVGRFGGIFDELVFLRYTHNMNDYRERDGFDVICYAIKDYVKLKRIPDESEEEPSTH